MHQTSRSGLIRSSLLSAGALVLIAGAAVTAMNAQTTESVAEAAGLTSQDAAIALISYGVDTDSAAGAGCTATQYQALIDHCAKSNELLGLKDAENKLEAARKRLSTIEETLWRLGSTPERQSELTLAKTGLAQAQASLDSASAAFRSLVAGRLSSAIGADNAALAMRMHDNAHRQVPAKARCMDLDSVAWETLERALDRQKAGETLTSSEQVALTAYQSSTLVSTVGSRINTNGDAIAAGVVALFAEPGA